MNRSSSNIATASGRRRLLGSGTLLGLGIGWAVASRPVRAQAAAADGPAVQALLDARLARQGVGLAAARLVNGRVEAAIAGRRAADQDQALGATHRFEIGSLSKTFVALLLARRVQARDVALDDPVEAALPRGLRLRDAAGAPLRWVDLATHRSGLPRLPGNLQPGRRSDPYADYDEQALYAFLEAWRPDRPRDARFEYSNLGFGLLGHALALQAGVAFDALLQREVLAPLGLSAIMLARPGVGTTDMAQGHDEQRQPVPFWHFGVLAGAGALRANLGEMLHYAQAAIGVVDTPLRAAFDLALAPRADGPGRGTRIGLAWFSTEVGGRLMTHHDGGTFGFASSLVIDRAARRGGLVLANAMLPVDDLARHLADPDAPLRDLAAEARATQAAAITLPARLLTPLAGVYAISPQFKVTITADAERLFGQATGQDRFELFARSPRQFFARVTALQISFEGESGPPPAFELQQGGQRLRFVRE
ncbi:MAG: serine hydrolase [Rubrivivax sp.]|nr:serine hydrolase [Rubrivivax sp.]